MENKGFTIIEIIIAMALMILNATLLMPMVFGVYMSIPSLFEKEMAVQKVRSILLSTIPYIEQAKATDSSVATLKITGSLSKSLFTQNIFRTVFGTSSYSFIADISDWHTAVGSNTCNIKTNTGTYRLISSYTLPTTFEIADLDVLNGYVYIVGKFVGTTEEKADFYVVNINNPPLPQLVSKAYLSPGGLGFTALHATERYVFLADKQTRYPMSIVSIQDKSHPIVFYQYQASTSTSITGYGYGSAINYFNKKVSLGLTKSTSSEIFIFSFNTDSAVAPTLIGSYETGTQVNSLIAKGEILFVATPEQKQVRLLDLHDPVRIVEKASITLPGYAVQDGKSMFLTGSILYLGRTIGGFDNIDNHELFAYDVSNEISPRLLFSKNIASTISDIEVDHGKGFLFVGAPNPHVGIYDFASTTPYETEHFSVTDSTGSIDCEDDVIVVASSQGRKINIYSH